MADVEFSTAKPNLNDLESRFTKASASAAASLQLHEDTDNGANKTTVTAPAALGADRTFTLPDDSGTALVGGLGATDNAVVRADGTGAQKAQGSGVLIDDSDNIIGVTAISGKGGGVGNLGLWIGTGSALVEEEMRVDGATGNVIFSGGRQIVIGASGVASPDVGIKRVGAGIVKITDASTGGGQLQFIETTDPSAPAANNCILYSRDNGSGKTQLCVRFPTGAVQVLATEP